MADVEWWGLKKSPEAYGQSSKVDWNTLGYSAGLGLFVQMSAVLTFSFLRRTRHGKQWLCSKRAVCPDQTPPDLTTKTLFGWIPELWYRDEKEILKYNGYDVVMFLRCLRLGFWTLLYFSPYAFFVILPTHLMSSISGDAQGYFTTTMSNLNFQEETRSDVAKTLTVHLIGLVLLQLILMVLTFNLQLEYIELRRTYHKQRSLGATVMVHDIPERLRSELLLKKYFDLCYGDDAVEQIQFVKHIDNLERLVASRENTVMALERSMVADRLNAKKKHKDAESSKRTQRLQERLDVQNTAASILIEEYSKYSTKKGAVSELERRSSSIDSDSLESKNFYDCGNISDLSIEEVEKMVIVDESENGLHRRGLARFRSATELAYGTPCQSSKRQRLSVSAPNLYSFCDDNGNETDSAVSSTKKLKKLKEWVPLTGAAVDFAIELRRVDKLTKKKKGDMMGSNSSVAFVKFKTVKAATMAHQVLQSAVSHHQYMVAEEAPDAIDMFWGNVHKSPSQKRALEAVGGLIRAGITIFFVVPVAYLNQYFGPEIMETYAETYGWPAYIKSLSVFSLPATLMIISNLLPPLYTGLGFFEGCVTWSANGLRQFDSMAWFLFINVFMVSLISSTIFESIIDIIKNPSGTASTIADVLPTLSGFFFQFIIAKACIALSVEVLRGLTVFHMLVRFLFRCKDATKKERLRVLAGIRRYDNPGWLPYGKHMPHILLVLAICVSFAPIAPLILIPGLMYFAYAQLIYRYTLSYVYEPRFEVGGGFWPCALKWIVRMMYLSQTFMVCIFVLRMFYSGVFISLAMMALTKYFQRFLHHKALILMRLPVDVAVDLDCNESPRPVFLSHLGDASREEHEKAEYVQPALIAERLVRPADADSYGKWNRLWSTDPLDGGYWHPISLAGRALKKCFCGKPEGHSLNDEHGISFKDDEAIGAVRNEAPIAERINLRLYDAHARGNSESTTRSIDAQDAVINRRRASTLDLHDAHARGFSESTTGTADDVNRGRASTSESSGTARKVSFFQDDDDADGIELDGFLATPNEENKHLYI